MRKQYSNSIYQKSLVSPNTLSRTFSIVNNTQNIIFNSYLPQNNMIELKDIYSLIEKDSNSKSGPPYNSVKALSTYIRRNRNSIEDIINKLSKYFEQNNSLNINLILNIVNSILFLLTEKTQIISFLKEILPILVKRLLFSNIKNLTLIENINNTIGNLIKIGGIYYQRYLISDINQLFNNLNIYDQKNKNENYIFASILYLCKIIENSSLFVYSKITEPKNFEIFKKIVNYFKDPKYEVRYAVGELIKQFNHMLMNRDSKTKYSYEQLIFYNILETYNKHLKDNNDLPTNIHLVSGMFEVLKKIYISEPYFLKKDENYNKIVQQIMKCSNSKIISIRIEFIKFIPELYLINKEIFTEKYLKSFLEYGNRQIALKANNDIRNAFFLTLGSLSLYIKKSNIFDISCNQLITLLNQLISNDNFDIEIFKCLADLLSNKENLYMERIVTSFNIYTILHKIFKNGLITYKIEFLISLMNAYSGFSKEHCSLAIASLNAVSLILCDEEFKLEYFYKEIADKEDNFISPKLDEVLNSVKKYIRRYMNNLINVNEINNNENQENMINNDYSSSGTINYKCLNDSRIVIYALTLFSQIENHLFSKDMLIFYNDKILPFLLFSSNKIKKKILELILCKFVKINVEDVNYSNYILNNIIDSIKNLIFSAKDIPVRIFAFNILHKNTLLLDIILQRKERFFSKLIGILATDEDEKIKEKLIQTIGILSSRSDDKNYFIMFTKKYIINLLFNIENCDDIIYKEDLICLLLYFTIYLKHLYDLNLMEQIIEVLINLNINYDYEGIIFVNTLKIVYELLNTDIINNIFLKDSKPDLKINNFCYILLIICVNNLKEGGDNTTKTELILKVLYQLVKIQKINIYKDINSNNITKTLDTLDINIYKKSMSFNNKNYYNQKSIKNNKDSQIDKEKNKNNINEKHNNELFSNIKKDEQISLVKILVQCIIKGLNDESLRTIMSIFGLSGTMDPSDIEKLFLHQDLPIYNLDGTFSEQDYFDDNEFKLIKYNPKTKMKEEINLSNIEPSTYKPIIYIIQFLKENSQQDLTGQILNEFNELINNLGPNEEKLIELIFPVIIEIIPQVDINYQKTLFNCIDIIMINFKKIIKANVNDLVELCKNYIVIDQYIKNCFKILNFLFENYVSEMEIYYSVFIPIFLSFIGGSKKEKKEKIYNSIKFFLLMTKNPNITSYLGIILNELTSLFLISDEYNNNLMEFFNKITSLQNIYYFFPLIINTLIEKLNILIRDNIKSKEKINKKLELLFLQGIDADKNKQLLSKIIDIFQKMNQINREHFIVFLPMIVKNLRGLGLIKYINYENTIQPMIMKNSDFNYKDIEEFENMIYSQTCFLNCYYGFNHIIKENIKNKKLIKKRRTNQSLKKSSNTNISQVARKEDVNNWSPKNNKKGQFMNTHRNRKNSINNELIINAFNAQNCLVEEDWLEWFKSTIKVLFDQSPSFTLYYCRFIAEYYFPSISELYNYAFFLAYKNNNDKNKLYLIDTLKLALQNPKTPNEILLTILNLAEFIERRDTLNNIFFFDYSKLGEVSYKCRAFAKALYYKENKFISSNDFDDIEGLIELYYDLKLPESAVGLLRLAEKNKDKIRKRSSLKFSFRKKSYESNNFSELNRSSLNFEKKDKDKEYILYIKMHNYDEALKLITKQLEKEKNEKNIIDLRKNKDICLNGLYDWEELLSDNEKNSKSINRDMYYSMNENIFSNLKEISENNEITTNQINEKKTNVSENGIIIENENDANSQINKKLNEENKLKEKIEKEILLSKACMNLGEWKELKNHFSKILKLIKTNNDIEDTFLLNKSDERNDLYDVNDINEMNEDFPTGNTEENENIFFINHGLCNGNNMNSLEKDLINLNKYISNYNRKKLEVNDNKTSTNKNKNDNLESGIFYSYIDLINNNQNLGFLENNEEILFNLNLYSTILNIESNKYDLALQYISEAKKLILPSIKSLLSESYIRGYELLVKNQMLYNLKQIIDYKQNHFGEKLYFNNMINLWDKNLEIFGQDVYLYEKFLAIRSLVLPISQEYIKYMDLVKICRKLKLYGKCEKILSRLKNKLDINKEIGQSNDIKMNEIQMQIELINNRCLFEKGEKKDAIDNSKYLVDLLDIAESNNNDSNILSKLNNKIKSQIYGNYAIYKYKNFTYSKKLINYL